MQIKFGKTFVRRQRAYCNYKLRYAGRPTDGVTELRMRPLPFLDLLCQTEIFHLLSKGALEPFGGFGWGRAAAPPPPPYSHLLCTHGPSVSGVHSTQPLRLDGARILGRCQSSIALESCVADVSSYLIRGFYYYYFLNVFVSRHRSI